MNIGRIGIWTSFDMLPAAVAQEAVREIESLGFGAVWIPEALGREVLTYAGLLLAGSKTIVIATGIANVWARDAMTMAAAQKTLCEAYPERFLLGIGVSHRPIVHGLRGHDYTRPYDFMRAYLDAMDAAPFMGPAPPTPPERVIGALHPKMLRLSAERAAGAHPYFVPPEHTRRAREILGPGKLLAPEQAVVLETDAARARNVARGYMQIDLGLPNYTRNLLSLGFTADDLANGGSDRLVDAIVAWGDVDAIARRVHEHFDCGADHVCLQVLDETHAVPSRQWRVLADALVR